MATVSLTATRVRRVATRVSAGAFAAIALAVPPCVLGAQAVTGGRLSGTVRDSAGRAVEGALVTATEENGTFARRVNADASGGWRIASVPTGRYTVTAQRLGFRPTSARGVVVRAGESRTVDLTLGRRAVTIAGVRVLEDEGAITVQKATDVGATRVSAVEIARLPVGTDLDRAVALSPGAREGSMWGAGGTAANTYQLDGAAVNHPGVGGAFIQPSMRFVQSVEIKGLGADAQEGGYQGGVISVITKSGDNTRRGELEAGMEPEGLNGSNLTPTSLVPEISGRRQFIGQLSGPLVRDRLFYFAGADWLAGDYRLLDHLAPTRGGFAPFAQRRTDTRLFGKLTFTPNDRDAVNLSVGRNAQSVEHADFTGRETIDATTSMRSPATVVNGSWRRLLGTSTTLELRADGFEGREWREPRAGTEVPGIYTYQLGTSRYYQNSAYATDRRARSQGGAIALDRFETILGHQHHLKVGIERSEATWRDLRTRNGGMSWRPRYSTLDGSAPAFDPSDASSWQNFTPTTWGGETDLATHTTSTAAYVQDEVTIGPVVLYPGLRFGAWQGNLDPTARGVTTRTRVFDATAVDPRLGFTLDLDSADFKVRFTGHWGRYHQGTFAELFDRAAGANAYTDQEIWEYSGPAFTDPRRVITLAEREQLAAQGQFRLIERVELSQNGPVRDWKQPYVEQYVAGMIVRPSAHWRYEFHFVSRDNRDIVALRDRNIATNYRAFENIDVFDRHGNAARDNYGLPLRFPVLYLRNDAIARLARMKKENPESVNLPKGITLADTALAYLADYELANVPDARRRFRQYELSIAAEYPRWSGSIAGTFNGLTGNFASVNGYDGLAIGGFEAITGRGPGPYVRPNESINHDGELDGSSFVTLKTRVSGELRWGFRGGVVGELVSGDPVSPTFTVIPNAFVYKVENVILNPLLIEPMARQRIYTIKKGVQRYPMRVTFDVHLDREIPLGRGSATIGVDVFNLLGNDQVTLRNTSLSSDSDPNSLTRYGAPLARQLPRQVRLSTAVRW